MLLLIIVLLLLFGGGGGYYGYSRWVEAGGWEWSGHCTGFVSGRSVALICQNQSEIQGNLFGEPPW